MRFSRNLIVVMSLLLGGCSHAETQTYLVAEILGPEGKAVRLVERRQIRRETSLLTPEGPKFNREAASLSRYFFLLGNREIELPFLEAKDEYRPDIWVANQGMWLAQIIPLSGDAELVLFESSGKVLDRCSVHLPFGRANGESVHFDKKALELVFQQKSISLHFMIKEKKLILVKRE